MQYKRNNRRGPSKAAREAHDKRMRTYLAAGCAALIVLLFLLAGMKLLHIMPFRTEEYGEMIDDNMHISKPEIDVELLTVNPYSRCGEETDAIRDIVIHYTSNPGSSAIDNRNYFEGLKDTHATKASSNFIVGLEGEIIQCVPTWEIAYASNNRNRDSVSIECCHPDESGEFNEATYRSMVHLTAWLCEKFGLTSENVIRHYDVTGKLCPKYFVENEEAWEQFKSDVGALLMETGKTEDSQ